MMKKFDFSNEAFGGTNPSAFATTIKLTEFFSDAKSASGWTATGGLEVKRTQETASDGVGRGGGVVLHVDEFVGGIVEFIHVVFKTARRGFYNLFVGKIG